jgi:hypothetical protein
MRRSDNRAALTDEVARFQAEVRRLALATVRAVVQQELDRKMAKLQAARPRAVPAPSDPPVVPAAVPTGEPPPDLPTTGRKRVPWTRDSIIKELATWMASGTEINATFVTRHGPPGLVAATRRVFGRFDAALNVVGLHLSKLYPDGPPGR